MFVMYAPQSCIEYMKSLRNDVNNLLENTHVLIEN